MSKFDLSLCRKFCEQHRPDLVPERCDETRTYETWPELSFNAAMVFGFDLVTLPPPLHPTNDQGASVQ